MPAFRPCLVPGAKVPSHLWMFGDRLVDINMMSAFARYFWYGLIPGYYGENCILGRYETAIGVTDSSLRPLLPGSPGYKVLGPQDGTKNMIDILQETLPEYAMGDNYYSWIQHIGLRGAPTSLKVHVKLIASEFWWSELRGVRYLDDLDS